MAAAVSGAPSTLITLARGEDVLMGARAAGDAAAAARAPHACRCSRPPSRCTSRCRWAGRSCSTERSRAGASRSAGVLGGLAIAALDLGVIGRRLPAIRDAAAGRASGPTTSPTGSTVGAVLARRRRVDSTRRMPELIAGPSTIEAAGTKPKLIEEFVGRVNTGEQRLSVARMTSPPGWVEPGQRPEFDEWTVVLDGCLHVEHEGGALDVRGGQADARRAPASGSATPRPRRAARRTSRSACRRSRRTRCIATTRRSG